MKTVKILSRMRLAALTILVTLATSQAALAASSVQFPFKGSDGNTYNGQTNATDAAGNGAYSLQPLQGTPTDVGGTITTASTSQVFAPALATRRGLRVQNQSTGALYISCAGAATLDFHSLLIPAGALYESSLLEISTGACSIIGATAGQTFWARQF